MTDMSFFDEEGDFLVGKASTTFFVPQGKRVGSSEYKALWWEEKE